MGVDLQVLDQLIDPLGQQRYLDIGRASIGAVYLVVGDNAGLIFFI